MKIITKSTITIPKIAVYKNVAAYCRVSTQQEIQHHSLKAQQQYYGFFLVYMPIRHLVVIMQR